MSEKLMRDIDETNFKKSYVASFLGAMDAVNYLDNCHRGWIHHKPPVEDAEHLADKAWDAWVEEIGIRRTDES